MVNVVVFDKFLLLIWVAASAAIVVAVAVAVVVVVDDIAVRLILAFLKELNIHKQFPEV